MSDESLKALISRTDMPPEWLDTDFDEFQRDKPMGLFESSKIEIMDALGKEEFKSVWLNLKEDITNESLKDQTIFIGQIQEKIFDIYGFAFPTTETIETLYETQEFYEYLEFLEYNNEEFLSHVWKFLGVSTLMGLDIYRFCLHNSNRVIKEIEEQLDVHPQQRLVSLFLRTLYKEKIIEWVIKNSKANKTDISVSIQLR